MGGYRAKNKQIDVIGMPIPVDARFQAQVYGHSPAEIVGSNPNGWYGSLSVVIVACCQVEVSATS